jgi:predicted nucleic acid-binding protein
MSLTICVDASLTLKLVLPEADRDLARALWADWLSQRAILIAPKLWGYEVTSVLRNRVHRGLLAPEAANAAFTFLHRLPIQLRDPAGLHEKAWELAKRFNRPNAYDSHYLALATLTACPFWTTDERLFNAVRSELGWIKWLGNYTP